MSSRPPTPASARFFLTIHRYITIPHTHRPHQPARSPPSLPRSHHRALPTRHASSSSPPPSKPSAPPTHYTLFPSTLPHGPPPSGPFPINLRALRHEYLTLQRHAHPDHYLNTDKAHSTSTSSHINEAYKTLQSPLLRAQYLLSLRGIDVGSDETATVEDKELLAEVLDVREEIENAEEEGELEGLKRGNEERIGESVGVLGEAFGRDDVEGARRECVRLRYWVNIKEALEGWEKGKPVVLVH